MNTPSLTQSPLGKQSSYPNTYTPSLLFPIPRENKRKALNISSSSLPFHGTDIWNAYECSRLNPKGKPQIAIAEFHFPCTSPQLIESKSFKLYLNSFTQSAFSSLDHVRECLKKDLSEASQEDVSVNLTTPDHFHLLPFDNFSGTLLDTLEIETNTYTTAPELLKTSDTNTHECLYSHLLKSNCPVTGQPDWGSLSIHYHGPKIDPHSLLKYIVSFRNNQEFHEQCIERIFMDLSRHCLSQKLTVYGRYTRRGGLDINPFRSNFEALPQNKRLHRQ